MGDSGAKTPAHKPSRKFSTKWNPKGGHSYILMTYDPVPWCLFSFPCVFSKRKLSICPCDQFLYHRPCSYREKYKNSLQAQIDAILIKSYVNRLFPSHHNGPFKSGVCVRNERVVGSNPISGSKKSRGCRICDSLFLRLKLKAIASNIIHPTAPKSIYFV